MLELASIAEFIVPIALGIVAGALSMLLYGRWSPQERLQELKLQCNALQRQMSEYDGDFSGARALAQRNLRLSFRRLGLALGPSLLSGIPVLAALPLIGHSFIAYFLTVALAAMVVKRWWKIS